MYISKCFNKVVKTNTNADKNFIMLLLDCEEDNQI